MGERPLKPSSPNRSFARRHLRSWDNRVLLVHSSSGMRTLIALSVLQALGIAMLLFMRDGNTRQPPAPNTIAATEHQHLLLTLLLFRRVFLECRQYLHEDRQRDAVPICSRFGDRRTLTPVHLSPPLVPPGRLRRLVTVTADAVRATSRGRLLLRIIAMCFDRYLNETQPPAATPLFPRVI